MLGGGALCFAIVCSPPLGGPLVIINLHRLYSAGASLSSSTTCTRSTRRAAPVWTMSGPGRLAGAPY